MQPKPQRSSGFAYVAQPGRVSAEYSIVAEVAYSLIKTVPKAKLANGWICGLMLSLRTTRGAHQLERTLTDLGQPPTEVAQGKNSCLKVN